MRNGTIRSDVSVKIFQSRKRSIKLKGNFIKLPANWGAIH